MDREDKMNVRSGDRIRRAEAVREYLRTIKSDLLLGTGTRVNKTRDFSYKEHGHVLDAYW